MPSILSMLKYLWRLTAATVVLMLLASGVVNLFSKDQIVNSRLIKQYRLFSTQPQALILGRDHLTNPGKKIIITGSSAVNIGLRPEIIKNGLPGYTVYNFSVDASYMEEMYETVQFCMEYLSPASRKDAVFVIGSAFYEFPNPVGESHRVEEEAGRYLQYSISGGEVRSSIPQPWLRTFLDSFQSAALVEKIINVHLLDYNSGKPLPERMGRNPFVKKTTTPPVSAGETTTLDPRVKLVEDSLGGPGINLNQLEFLVKTASLVSANGASLVIVELPIPTWMEEKSDHFHDYQRVKKQYLDQALNFPKTHYLDLSVYDDPSLFSDSRHPTESGAGLWSSSVREFIQKSIAHN